MSPRQTAGCQCFPLSEEDGLMEKMAIIEKMEEKGLTAEQVAESMEFSANLLALYLTKDAYPVPKRILDKVAAIVMN
jgi:hypothetical protein